MRGFDSRNDVIGMKAFKNCRTFKYVCSDDSPKQPVDELEKELEHCDKYCKRFFDGRYIRQLKGLMLYSVAAGLIAATFWVVSWGNGVSIHKQKYGTSSQNMISRLQ